MERPMTQHIRPGEEPMTLREYERVGGYKAVHKALKEMAPGEIQKLVQDANLKGRGGAGFNAGLKWSFVPMGNDAPRVKYLCANADEMEPGTFKDRIIMEGNPHLFIEGMICEAYAIQATTGYIFLRWAYKLSERRLRKALSEAYEAGYLGKNILSSGFDLDIMLHVSAGRYMCGEETGLLNALEGRRATPRAKPPYPQTSGLWGKPTVVNNVETMSNIPYIILNGAEAYKNLSRSKDDGGTKIYGMAGNVKRPGWWELPMGTPLREIIEEHAGGMKDGYRARAVIPGGASTDFIMEKDFDIALDFVSVPKVGSRMGTGTILMIDDKVCPVRLMHNLMKFFAQESCGWCTPCREGLPWVRNTLAAIEAGQGEMEDLDMIERHGSLLGPGNTYCALAPGAAEPMLSGIKFFREDFERHIKEKRCPWR